MELRVPHEHPKVYATLELILVIFGFWVAYRSWMTGGVWLWLCAAALFGEALLVYSVIVEPRWLTVRRYREALRSHSGVSIRIVFLSDLHAGGRYPDDWWQRIALEVQALAPDMVILGGDYVLDAYDPITDLAPLKKITAPLGKYFVLGNHDFLDRPQDVRTAIEQLGYQDLTHQSIVLHHEGRDLEIQGLDDHWFGTFKSFMRRSPHIPHILIAHEPDALLDLEAEDTDLVLSGHTHGGQVWLPGIGAPWIPTKLGRAADRGRKRINNVTAIISNGLGQTPWHPRLGCRPQIVVVEVGI